MFFLPARGARHIALPSTHEVAKGDRTESGRTRHAHPARITQTNQPAATKCVLRVTLSSESRHGVLEPVTAKDLERRVHATFDTLATGTTLKVLVGKAVHLSRSSRGYVEGARHARRQGQERK